MLEPREFGLGDFDADQLNCPGEKDPHCHVRAVTAALLPRLAEAPDLLLVQGDTSSALGASLAGFTAGVPVGHVEAGLRTHDPLLPWPEEEYRTAIDAGAELLFAPTAVSAANLKAESVTGHVHITGNTSIDAVLHLQSRLAPARKRTGSPRLLVTCHRRESWGEGLQSIAAAVADLAKDAHVRFVLHPNPHVAAQMRALLGSAPNVELLEPCDHLALLQLMRESDLVLSDSGGIQEEAPALGVPLLVLREKTERPEGIVSGCAKLVGTSTHRIVDEVRRLLADETALASMRRPSFPYGDGTAAQRIGAIVHDWLKTGGGGAGLAQPSAFRAPSDAISCDER
jgi:UDP-N-acetylglucosamine 2-epimerase (non-hydrolysing)